MDNIGSDFFHTEEDPQKMMAATQPMENVLSSTPEQQHFVIAEEDLFCPPLEDLSETNRGPTHQQSNAAEIPELLSDQNVAPRRQTRTAPLDPDSPLRIHGRTVEEYQQIYHEVVDGMLKDEDGENRPYSLELGRRIKLKLWERLNFPRITTTTNADGLVQVSESYGDRFYTPQEFGDITSDELSD